VFVTQSAPGPVVVDDYNLERRMVQDGVEWFGEVTPTLAINVNPLPIAGTQYGGFHLSVVPGVMSAGTTTVLLGRKETSASQVGRKSWISVAIAWTRSP
jgi:hypothetical protein